MLELLQPLSAYHRGEEIVEPGQISFEMRGNTAQILGRCIVGHSLDLRISVDLHSILDQNYNVHKVSPPPRDTQSV